MACADPGYRCSRRRARRECLGSRSHLRAPSPRDLVRFPSQSKGQNGPDERRPNRLRGLGVDTMWSSCLLTGRCQQPCRELETVTSQGSAWEPRGTRALRPTDLGAPTGTAYSLIRARLRCCPLSMSMTRGTGGAAKSGHSTATSASDRAYRPDLRSGSRRGSG
jgi:hypothetical protein